MEYQDTGIQYYTSQFFMRNLKDENMKKAQAAKLVFQRISTLYMIHNCYYGYVCYDYCYL